MARGNDVLVTGESGHAFIRYAGAWTPMKMDYDGSQFACLVGADGAFYSFGLRGSAFKAPAGAPKGRVSISARRLRFSVRPTLRTEKWRWSAPTDRSICWIRRTGR
ncbi:MAG: hypothetical protein WDN04_18960 [Rhodospirillales bacterium]